MSPMIALAGGTDGGRAAAVISMVGLGSTGGSTPRGTGLRVSVSCAEALTNPAASATAAIA